LLCIDHHLLLSGIGHSFSPAGSDGESARLQYHKSGHPVSHLSCCQRFTRVQHPGERNICTLVYSGYLHLFPGSVLLSCWNADVCNYWSWWSVFLWLKS